MKTLSDMSFARIMDWLTCGIERSKCTIWTTSPKKQPKWNFIARGICLFCFLLAMVNAQCVKPNPSFVTISETAHKGTVIFNVSAKGTTSWVYMMRKQQKHSDVRCYLRFRQIGDHYFMTLVKPPDLEELVEKYGIYDSGFPMILTCRPDEGTPGPDVDFDFYFGINPVNEYAPEFNTSNINVYANETNTIGVMIANLSHWASDEDRNPFVAEINQYSFLQPINPRLGIRFTDGGVFNNVALDFDELPQDQKYIKETVQVRDYGGMTATASLTVHILDVDDLPPRFIYTDCRSKCENISYSSVVRPDATGKLFHVEPAEIYAEDRDTINASITYTIIRGPPGYQEYLMMNPTTGEVFIRKPLEGFGLSKLALAIKAEENTILRHHTITTLFISGQYSHSEEASDNDDNDGMNRSGFFSFGLFSIGMGMGILIFLIILGLAIIYRNSFKKLLNQFSSKENKEEEEEKKKKKKKKKEDDEEEKK